MSHRVLAGWCCARMLLLLAIALPACSARIVPPSTVAPAVRDDIAATVFLIGDAGAPKRSGEPVLEALQRALAGHPDSTLILFLGDNAYPLGLPDSADGSFPEIARRLRAQVDFARDVPVVFVPGNHDWHESGPEGLERIRRQGRFIERESGGRARLVPAGGCPGPDLVDAAGVFAAAARHRVVAVPAREAGSGLRLPDAHRCGGRGPPRQLLRESGGRQVIVAGHHPILTGGPHGGYFSLSDHVSPLRALNRWLFLPLPILGSAYPLARSLGISAEDLSAGPIAGSGWRSIPRSPAPHRPSTPRATSTACSCSTAGGRRCSR